MTTGYNPTYVNNCVTAANNQAQKVLDEFADGAQAIVDAVAKNYASKNAMTFGGELAKTIKSNGKKMIDNLSAISKTIVSTANYQQQRSGNNTRGNGEFTVAAKAPTMKDISTENFKEKLDNGYVGATDTLITEVEAAASNLSTNFSSKLTVMRNTVTAYARSAFKSEQVSQVANAISTYCDTLNATLNSFVTEVVADINTVTGTQHSDVVDIQTQSATQINNSATGEGEA